MRPNVLRTLQAADAAWRAKDRAEALSMAPQIAAGALPTLKREQDSPHFQRDRAANPRMAT